ncbi:hypothetical protein JB92DRAFT_3024362 [Gautieria morchelliformis]|nr:hypothetical protein JB92DRAFT_3024362 [Gautieria morchelliformis]
MISATAVGGGELYVASYGEHDIAGVAGWFGPGTGFMNTPEQGEAGFNALMASFSPDLMKWWTEYFLPKYEVQTTTALGEGTKLAAWHLQIIGVLPEHQGKGIGGALVRTVESKALPNGVACCLEAVNDAIVPIYAHWGYVDKGEEHYESLAGGSFPTYVMMKSPPGNAA